MLNLFLREELALRKAAVLVAVCVFLVAFAFSVMAPATHAAVPKLVKCWSECIGHVELHCCKYVVPGAGGGTFTECEASPFPCTPL